MLLETKNPTPLEIRLSKDKKNLTVTFKSGLIFEYPAEYLRVESPSAEVQGHGAEEKVTVGGKSMVTITDIKPVGNYAIQIIFSDGHDTGFYTWENLQRLALSYDSIWPDYLAALEEKGLSRDFAF
ncbi:MAG: hypothetical protein CMF31_06470 [Kordiimonas sp.]|nr:hypothetical protein [Kordiimonas sp.]|tara:strand:+ start:4576 stop:4953 length:378 start_codon:yes stop_codon:yes gene_type:complete